MRKFLNQKEVLSTWVMLENRKLFYYVRSVMIYRTVVAIVTWTQGSLLSSRGEVVIGSEGRTGRNSLQLVSYYKSSSVCLFVCLSVCLFVPYLLRGPLTDLRQTWWVYVGGPRNCPWGVLFRKGQRLDGSTGHFHFPLYYICASLTPHSCKRRLCCYCI